MCVHAFRNCVAHSDRPILLGLDMKYPRINSELATTGEFICVCGCRFSPSDSYDGAEGDYCDYCPGCGRECWFVAHMVLEFEFRGFGPLPPTEPQYESLK